MSAPMQSPSSGQPMWTMPWIGFEVYELILYQVRLAAAGVENTVITGPKGVGKTSMVRRALDEFSDEEAERVAGTPEAEPVRNWVYYASGSADGRKTALRDLLGALGRSTSPGRMRHWSVRDHCEAAVTDLRGTAGNRNARVVCIDEADRIDLDNLNDLRQVIDEADHRDYPLGMILIGNGAVASHLAANAELGQRFSTAIAVGPFNGEEIRPRLPDLHPGLEALSKEDGWDELADDILDAARGAVRRLERILENADIFARAKSRPLDDAAIRFALRKLAG